MESEEKLETERQTDRERARETETERGDIITCGSGDMFIMQHNYVVRL